MTVVYTSDAKRQLSKLDNSIRKRIKAYMDKISKLNDPRSRGKGLKENRSGQWRYRVGDYRVICEIHDTELIIMVIALDHRGKVYL